MVIGMPAAKKTHPDPAHMPPEGGCRKCVPDEFMEECCQTRGQNKTGQEKKIEEEE